MAKRSPSQEQNAAPRFFSQKRRALKKKKAAKVANNFDAYGRDERTKQRREAGRKGGQATARKSKTKGSKSQGSRAKSP